VSSARHFQHFGETKVILIQPKYLRGFEALCCKRIRVPMRWLNCFQFTSSFQPHHGPVVYSNRNEYQKQYKYVLGSRARPARNADIRAAIYEPTVWTMWDPQRLTTPKATTACYGDSFTLWRRSVLPARYELDCKYCYK
jgi:hypothetical protein